MLESVKMLHAQVGVHICFALGMSFVAAFPSCPHLRSALVPLPPGGGSGLGAGGGTYNGRLHRNLYLERSRRGTPPGGVGLKRGKAKRDRVLKGSGSQEKVQLPLSLF
mgnify:CR=1 FL=1